MPILYLSMFILTLDPPVVMSMNLEILSQYQCHLLYYTYSTSTMFSKQQYLTNVDEWGLGNAS